MKFPQSTPLMLSVSFLIIGTALLAPQSAQSRAEESNSIPESINYAEHVAPILNRSCVPCHRPGQTAPFSLIGYENAKRYSDMIAIATDKRRMPPWKAVKGDLEFRGDMSLTSDELRILKLWADSGAPRGDAAREPKPPTFRDGWQLGEPDLLVEMPHEIELEADGADEYWNFVITPKIDKPTWVSAIDVEPGNRRIVHHVIAFLDSSGQGRKLVHGPRGDGKSGYRTTGGGVGFMPEGALGGWAPGATAARLPSAAGILLKPGTDVILQVHYNKSGKPEKDRTRVALYTAPDQPTDQVQIVFIPNLLINIKPGLANQTFTQRLPLPRPVKVYTLMPHMHLLGKSMKVTAAYPDGTSKTLINVQDWDFNWQTIYHLKEPEILPAGTLLTIEATFDNSADNPFQPHDPPRTVRWGEETTDEMMLLVAGIAPVKE